jgi:hypothetical protein
MVNLVRSGTKQPQPFSTSAEGQARHLPFSVFPLLYLPSSVYPKRSLTDAAVAFLARFILFFSIGPLACFNEAATRVRAPSRFGFARHRY